MPKKESKKFEDIKEGSYDDIKVLVYSQVKKTNIKKTPDMHEIGLSGELHQKLDLAKNIFSKDISFKDFVKEGIVDVRGLTKGKGLNGPTKRYGLDLRSHKAEKGQRFHGSGGPWHPSRVEYTQPMAGQLGFFTRVNYNNKIIFSGNINETNINQKGGFMHFGDIKNDYIILQGSISGPQKRALLITAPLRPNKKHVKKNFEFLELR